MNLSFNKKAALSLALLLGLGGAYYAVREHALTDWVQIGVGGPTDEEDFKYRYINLVSKRGETSASHPDLTRLILDLQSRRAVGSWVYVPVYDCHSPNVRNGVPTVMCKTIAGSIVYIGGRDGIREKLLSLRRTGDKASLRAKALGLYAETPVLWVVDDSLEHG